MSPERRGVQAADMGRARVPQEQPRSPAPTARPSSQHPPHGSRIPAHAQQIPSNPIRNPKPGKGGEGCQAEGCQARG